MTDVSIGDVSELNSEQDLGLRIEVAPGALPGPGADQGSTDGDVLGTGALEEAIVAEQSDESLAGDQELDDLISRYLKMESPQEFVRQAVPVEQETESGSALERFYRRFLAGASMSGPMGLPVPGVSFQEPRKTLYRSGGPGTDPEDAVIVSIDNPNIPRANNPIGYMAKNAANGFYHGIDEIQEVVTGGQISDFFSNQVSPRTGQKSLFAKDLVGELAYDVGAITAVVPPALALYAFGKAGIKTAGKKALDPLLRRVIGAPYRTVLNAISPRVTGLVPIRNPRMLDSKAYYAGQATKYATAGAVGEQIITDDDELIEQVDQGDGVLVPRLGKVLVETEYPILQDLGRILITDKDDPIKVKRALKFADDLGIGLVFDGALYSAMFMGHLVKKGAGRLAGKHLDGDVPDIQALDVGDVSDPMVELKRTIVDSPGQLSREDFEELSKAMFEDGGFAQIEYILERAGVTSLPLKKMIGSLNATHLQGSEEAGIEFIKHMGDVLEKEAKAAGLPWPPKKGYKATEEDAILFEQENAQALQDTLTGMTADGTPLRMHQYMTGIQLGPGLEGLDVYVLASRRALMRSNEHVYLMAKDAASAAKLDDPLERVAAKTAFLQAYMAHRRLQETVNGSMNQVGRALSSLNAPVTGDQKLKYITNLVEAGGKDLDDLIDKIALTPDDPKEIARIMNGLDDTTASQEMFRRISTLWHNSILSAIDTQIVNAVGSVYGRTLQDLIEYPLAALTNEVKRKAGVELAPDSILMEDVKARMGAYTSKQSLGTFINEDTLNLKVIQMMRDGRMQELLGDSTLKTLDDVDVFLRKQDPGLTNPRNRLRALAQREIEMEVLANSTNLYKSLQFFARAFAGDATTLARFRGSSNEFVASAGPDAVVPVRNSITNMVRKHGGTVLNYAGKTMAGVDSAMKSLSQNIELHMGASQMIRNMRYQMEKNGNKELKLTLPGEKAPVIITPDMLDPTKANGQLVQELIHRIVSNPPPSLLERANKEMIKSVYQENTPLTQGLTSLRRMLNDKLGTAGLGTRATGGLKIPFGTTLMTFIKSPVNLVTFTMDRIPLVYLYGKQNRDALNTPGAARDMVLARKNAGMMTIALSFELARRGIITGSSPAEGISQQMSDRQAGFQPDAFVDKNTGNHYQFTRGDPLAMTLGVGARLYEVGQTFLKADGLSEVEKLDVSLRLGLVQKQLFVSTLTMLEDRLYISNLADVVNVIGKSYQAKEGEKMATALEGGAKIFGRQLRGLVPNSNLIARLEEGYRTLDALDPERIANLPTEERRELMNKSFGAYDAGFLFDPRIRELAIVEDTLLRTALALMSGFPSLQQKAYELATDGDRLHGKVTQFGEITQRALPVPPFVPLTRKPPQPSIIATSEDNTKITSPFAPLHLLERKYGFEPLRAPRKITLNGVEVSLDAEQYHMRQRIQGERYARHMRDIFMGSNENDGFNVKAMTLKIELARQNSVQHATHEAKRMYVQLTDRADKIGTVKKLEEEIREDGIKAMNSFTALQKQMLRGLPATPDRDE